MTVLRVKALSKRFGGLSAINCVSFTVDQQQIFSIIGPNGAGKSTLLKLITGFETPSSGNVFLEGAEITGQPAHRIARGGVVRTFQENAIFADMTARQAIGVAHHVHRRTSAILDFISTASARQDRERTAVSTEEILGVIGLTDYADRPAVTLSHGHLRALGIGVALATEPRLLLLDEPLAGLNPDETTRGMALIETLRNRGLTIVLVEHDMRAVMAISDRVLVINFGSFVAEGPPDWIRNDPAVIEAYLGLKDTELDL
jgi:branched-chain amino acid transport system ATP-binding protein